MILDDRHINYLKLVKEGRVALWWAPGKKVSRYVTRMQDTEEIDQQVAAQMKALGMTHVVANKSFMNIALTERGENTLIEEDETW